MKIVLKSDKYTNKDWIIRLNLKRKGKVKRSINIKKESWDMIKKVIDYNIKII